MKANKNLILKLQEKMTLTGISHSEFARELGISRQAWDAVRNGTRNPGLRVLSAIVKTYPELENEVLFFLHSFATEVAKTQFSRRTI